MFKQFYALTICLAVLWLRAEMVVAQDLRGPIGPVGDNNSSTSVEDVVLNNPIQLHIAKTAPSGELLEQSGSIGIDDAVHIGIKNNFSLKESEQGWQNSKFLARAALGKFGPSASFNTLYSSSSLNQMLFFPGDTSVASTPMQPIVKGTSLSLFFAGTQPIFTGGRLMGGYRAARAIEKQSLAAYNEQRIQTALSVKESYWNAAWAEASLRVASDYVRFREWSSKNMRARMTEGKAPREDYLREEAEVAKARIEQNEKYRDFNSALLNLKVAMSVNIGSMVSLKDRLEYAETAEDLNSFLALAARRRPEIARASSRVAEMKARRLIAISKYSPQVNAYGLGSNISGSSPDGNASGGR